jgi:GT2 family glycosyltransferase
MIHAAQILDPINPKVAAWARFDAAWYLGRYPEARHVCGGDPAAAMEYYLETGAKAGHSPSPLFDERYYLASNPDVHELVRGGKYRSGFDHFCQFGHRLVSPHWLFDDRLYGRLYDDMTIENLDHHNCYGRYDHYLKSGQFEGRIGQFLFDPAYYRKQAIEAGAAGAEIDACGPYVHFLYWLQSGRGELAPSVYFAPKWYLQNNFGARAEIHEGLFQSAIEHYLCNDSPETFDPVPEFSEAHYRETYRDIAQAVVNHYFRNGYQHFLQFGAFELRSPNHEIDLVYYCEKNPRVRDDLNSGAVRDAFAHLRLIGLAQNLEYSPPNALPLVTEAGAKQLFFTRAMANLALFGRRALGFAPAGAPAVSVIMVVFNKFELTMLALTSLRDNFAGDIELIIVDNGSTDDTVRIGQYVTGAVVVRLSENMGFLRAANIGLEKTTAPAVLYLNNDTELGHGAIAAALARLNSAPDIGAVGGKIIRSHGKLQEAGSIIWRDGTAVGYMRDASPLAPEANFVRDVDFCSAVFLLCRTELVKGLGGFDEDFSPAYYEDADLCVRMAGANFRIVYDPSVVIFHLEYGSAASTESSMREMRRRHKAFAAKHKEFLASKRTKSAENLLFARAVSAARGRVLFLEDTVPLRRLGSGFVRANDVVRAIVAAGYDVTVFPINGAPYDAMSIFGDLPERVEVAHDVDINVLGKFLAERRKYFDLVWVSRTHNLDRVLPIFEQAGISPERVPFVLDTEAVVSVRDAVRAAVTGGGDDFNFDAALSVEFAQAGLCRHVLATSRTEVDLLHSIELPKVSLLGTCRSPAATEKEFAARSGLLFVGGIHQADSPNLDSLHWYVNEILPALAAEFDTAPVLHVAGYCGPNIDLSAFGGNKFIRLHGMVADLTPLYNECRVFIAPTRFAAGTPYKIYEAAAHGLPCVATDLLAAQLGWQSGGELLAAPINDARRFAAQIAVLYRTEAVWSKLRKQALARLKADHAAENFNRIVAEVLEDAIEEARQAALVARRHRRPARHSVPVG